jgi:methyl-accepting chemotaxis protein
MLNRVHGRWSLPKRFAAISLLFVAPIILLGYLYVSQSLSVIGFAQTERDGTRYLMGVWPTFAGAATGRNGGSFAPDSVLDQQFNTGAQARAFQAATSPAARVQAGFDLIDAIADGSNLTLDPDLDSYYVQDAATIQMPALVKSATELRSAVNTDEGTGMAAALAFERLRATGGRLGNSLDRAMKNNKSGETGKALGDKASRVKTAITAVPKPEAGRKAEITRAIDGLLAEADAAWGASASELDRLLLPASTASTGA